MLLDNADQNITRSKRQAGGRSHCHNRANKATYNAVYYKSHRFAINCTKAIKCGNAHGKQSLKHATIQ